MPDTKALNILVIEDNEDDALLLLHELRHSAGFDVAEFNRVQTAAALESALRSKPWHIVLSDYSLPGFNGMEALKLVQHYDPDLPFILVSGFIGEETAVAALKAGVHDYVHKERLYRLPQVVRRELFEAHRRHLLHETQAELAVAKEFAESANQRKSQVLAFVAHEFKNPLQAITLFAEQLTHAPLEDVHTQAAQNIYTAVNQLHGLVEDILDIAAIEAGKIHLEYQTLALSDIIDESLIIVGEQAKQRNISIRNHVEGQVLPDMTGDPKRLRQILINLLSNAIKYSPEGSLVSILIEPEPDNNRIHLNVVDQGIGIGEDDLRQLFKEFYRVFDRFNSQTEGIGLGLALTKQLVELHQGHIDVSSEPGKGSTFRVTLPIHATSAPSSNTHEPSQAEI